MQGHLPPSLVGHSREAAPSSTCEICSLHATPAVRKFKERCLNLFKKLKSSLLQFLNDASEGWCGMIFFVGFEKFYNFAFSNPQHEYLH